ncbi:MAG: NADH-quinone oxidoreductase subunit J [Candidatus Omnitrophica bacterium]|nr:NADH-quinone oxidoreductase subunit J [Candidatus Omnitrophota bacterium]
MTIDIIILIILTLAALWTVMTNTLLFAAIGLALTSAVLTIVMFRLNSPLAAVFELSVCAGLISVVFISVTTMTQPQSHQEVAQHNRDRLGRFKFLPLIIILVVLTLVILNLKPTPPLTIPEAGEDVRNIIWNQRPFDLIGQVLILLAGVFGVVILFKEKPKDE